MGHPWVYANEIGDVDGFEQAGAVVSVFSSNGSFVGKGYYNPDSKISVRFLTRQAEIEINHDFFLKRIKKACLFRKQLKKGPIMRLVAGEADGLPGLVIDQIGNYLFFSIHTLGMEQWKETIVACIQELFPDCFVFEKNVGYFRKAESLPECSGFRGNPGAIEFCIDDAGLFYWVNTADARPGLYWEQLEIFKCLAPFVKGKRLVDAFCHHGYLAMRVAQNGASAVCGIDWSETAIASAEKNARLNTNCANVRFQVANAYTKLKQMAQEKQQYDLVVLDPPAMAGIGKGIDKALLGYEKLFDGAIKLLPESSGLLLFTVSGHQLSCELLFELLQRLTHEQGKKWRIISEITQPADHPVLWQLRATQYFRAWLVEIWHEIS